VANRECLFEIVSLNPVLRILFPNQLTFGEDADLKGTI
jgi:hypothetical protein